MLAGLLDGFLLLDRHLDELQHVFHLFASERSRGRSPAGASLSSSGRRASCSQIRTGTCTLIGADEQQWGPIPHVCLPLFLMASRRRIASWEIRFSFVDLARRASIISQNSGLLAK